jgi:hypothetical protein
LAPRASPSGAQLEQNTVFLERCSNRQIQIIDFLCELFTFELHVAW